MTVHALKRPTRSLEITYGDRVRRARLSTGLTQQEFADQVGVTSTLLGRHEGMDEPPTRNRRALAVMIEHAYGIDADWLLTGEAPGSSEGTEGLSVAGVRFELTTSGLRARERGIAPVIPIRRGVETSRDEWAVAA
jgi:transcriptional regulator with XRE-family HTH domain